MLQEVAVYMSIQSSDEQAVGNPNTRDVEKACRTSDNDSKSVPDTVMDHESFDVLIVFRTAELNRPTRKAIPTIATATGSSSVIDRQHETAAALSAPVQSPESMAADPGYEYFRVSTLLSNDEPRRFRDQKHTK